MITLQTQKIIRRLIPLFAASISYVFAALHTALSGYSYPWNTESWLVIGVLCWIYIPLIVYSYVYMWMYVRLRQKYKRWKILSISIFYFFALLIMNGDVYTTLDDVLRKCLLYTTFFIPFIILLLYTDKFTSRIPHTEAEFYKFVCWISPFFAALISSFLGRIRFWIYQFIYHPEYEGSMEDIFPYHLRFWVYYIPIFIGTWIFIFIYNKTKHSKYNLIIKIVSIGLLSIFIYSKSVFSWQYYDFGIWGIIKFEIPFLIMFFTAQKHIK